MTVFLLALVAFLLVADPVQAGPVFFAALSAGAGFGSAFAATTVGSFLTTTIVGRLLSSVALSALSQALAPKPRSPGIRTGATAAGGTNPSSFILGRYATAGFAVCPPMSHGTTGKTPNAYLTYVIELGDIPGQTLERLMIDEEYVDLGATPHADYGQPVLGRFEDHAWLKYYDGSQTAADPMLLAKYASYPERPWSADMTGTGLCYAILTFRYNREIFNSLPKCRFQMGGIPLYHPRRDSSANGSGSHRWDDPATWEPSDNPVVQVYNILRGIALPDGSVWGGGAAAADLPTSAWFAAMNECDVAIPLEAGGSEKQFRSGFEVAVDEDPATVIEELLKGCSGQIAEVCGVWKVRVGGPGLPVLFLTDEDVIVSRPQEFDPFPGLDRTWNGIHASYPEPDSLWEPKDAPPRYNADYEAADQGRRLVANLSLPSVPYGDQVQRIMRAYVEEERRFRRHSLTLPPEAAILEPLDAIAWTSARNGYIDKVFEVSEAIDDLGSCLLRVALRERDPADYDWEPAFELPSSPSSGALVVPAVQAVPGWSVTPVALADAGSADRRAALRLGWDGEGQDDVRALEWEARLAATTAVVLRGSTHSVVAGEITLADGILPATGYEARGRFVVDRPTEWSAWVGAVTPDVRLGSADLDTGLVDLVNAAVADAAAADARADEVLAMAEAAVSALNAGVIAAFGPLDVAVSLTERVITAYGPLDAAAPLADRVVAAYGPLEASVPLTDRVVAAYGPLDAATSLTDRVIAAYGPLDMEVPLVTRATALEADMTGRIADIARIDRDLALAIPRGVQSDEAIATLEGQLAWLTTRLSQTQSTMADAGIYIDPASGAVRIEAISRVEGQVTEVGLTLDALEGAIALKASTAYVNQALSEALLDPTQIPLLDAFNLRLSEVELNLSAAEGAISAKAETTLVAGQDVRLTAAELDIDSLEAAIALRVETTAFTALTERVTTAEVTLNTLDGAAISLAVQDVRAQGEAVEAASITSLQQLLDAYDSRAALRVDLAYARQDFRALVDEDRAAMASLTTQLGVAFGDAVALIEAVQLTQVSATEALAQDITATEARLDLTDAALNGLSGTVEGLTGTLAGVATGVTALTSRVALTEAGLLAEALRVDDLDAGLSDAATGLSGQGVALAELSVRVTGAEGGLQVISREATVLTAGVQDSDDAAALADLRLLLTGEATRTQFTQGVAGAREELTAKVVEGQEALAAARLELDAAIGTSVALISAETQARATADQALALRADDLQAGLSDVATGLSGQGLALTELSVRATGTEAGLEVVSREATTLSAGVQEADDAAAVADLRLLLTDQATRSQFTQGVAGAREELTAKVVEGQEALAATRLELDAAIGASVALISAETQARVTADQAEAAERLILQASLDGTTASLAQEVAARATADAAIALRTDSLEARLEGAETGITAGALATDGLEARVSTAEGAIDASSTAITQLQAEIEVLDTLASASAVQALELRITSAEGVNTSQGSAITALQNGLTTANGGISANTNATTTLATRVTAAEGAIDASSTAITQLQAEIEVLDTLASASAVQALEVRVTAAEGVNTSQGSAITALQNGLTTANGSISANAAATTSLATRVTAAEGVNSSQGSAITSLQNSLAATNSAVAANSSAVSVLDSRVDGNDTSLTAYGQRIDTLEADVTSAEGTIAAQGSAISALTTRVSTAEGEVDAIAEDVTDLTLRVTNAETGLAANASAVSALQTRITSAEGVNTSQGSAITALQNGLTTANGGISANANATTTLATRVTAAEGVNSSQGSAITSLQNSLAATNSAVAANSSAVSVLDSRVDGNDVSLTAYGQRIDTLEADVTSAEGTIAAQGSAISALTTRVSTAEGEVDAIAEDVTDLTLRVTNAETGLAANASAVSALQTRITSAEGVNTSQGTAITALQNGLTTANGGISANAAATTSLATRVTAAEGVNSSQGSAITSLQNSLAATNSSLAATSSAVSVLDSRVDGNDADLTAYGQRIDTLEADVTNAEGTMAAQGSALSGLTTRVTTAEGAIASITQASTALSGRVSTAEGDLALASDAIDLLETRVSSAEGVNSTQATQISGLTAWLASTNGTVATKANASTVSGLITDVTEIEGQISSLAASLLQLESSIGDRVNAVPGNDLTLADLWNLGAGWALVSPSGVAGFRSIGALRYSGLAGSGNSAPAASQIFTVVPGASYRAAFQARGATAGNWTVTGRMVWRAEDDTQLSTATIGTISQSSTSVFEASAELVVPANARKARIEFTLPRATLSALVDVAAPVLEKISSTLASTRAALTVLQAASTTALQALASRTTTLEATAGGLSASLSEQAAALATLEGYASATYSLRVSAGGASAGLELVAANDPVTGPTSVLRIDADNILLDGTVRAQHLVADQVLINAPGQLGLGVVGGTQLQDTSVTTLKIGGNAVTVPVRAFVAETLTLTSASVWTTIAQVSLNRQGYATEFHASFSIDGFESGSLQLGLFRGSTEIRGAGALTGPNGRQQTAAFSTVDFDTGTGATTYSLRARKSDPAGTAGWNADVRVWRRYLSATQFQR